MITQSISVRHPYIGEVPADLMTGFECFKLDPEFQWVLIHEGQVKAQMICANMHGVLFIMRLISQDDAPNGWAVTLMRHVMKESKERGLFAYATFLSDKTAPERKLMRIIQRVGGILLPVTGVWAFGGTEIHY